MVDPHTAIDVDRASSHEPKGEKFQDSMNVETDSSGKTTNNSSNRLAWDSRVQYLFMVIAYSVGLSNIWRFPYLTQRHGRGNL